jgi:NAD-dependent DNA ligase
MKKMLIDKCPFCDQDLYVQTGKGDNVYKLVCINIDCEGSQLKRLQKGVEALNIKSIGPKIVEKLYNCGFTNALNLFDPSMMNKEFLIKSGEFVKGRSLDIVVDNIKAIKEIPINLAILSLQIDNIGKTFSEKIGRKMSGEIVDFTGLMLNEREMLDDKDSDLNLIINTSLEKFKEFGVDIKLYEPKKIEATLKIKKCVEFEISDNSIISDLISKLDWNTTNNIDESDMLIVDDAKIETNRTAEYKNVGKKVMSIKQIKLLFL